jgi:hypothetical protein
LRVCRRIISRNVACILLDAMVILPTRQINQPINARFWIQKHVLTRGSNLIDSTAVALDLNICKKRYRKADLVNQEYAWGYSTTNG